MVLHETKIRLSKAVLLRDAFTGEPVSSAVRLRSLSGGRVERKSDGYFLFLDVGSPQFEIETESPIYQRKKICLAADAGREVEEVLMYPSPSYPLRSGCTAVRGKAAPGSILRCYVENEDSSSRLINDYKKGEAEISLYLRGGAKSVLWHIQEKQKKMGEFFRIKNFNEGMEVYHLSQSLKYAYHKKDTVISPAQETEADENGEFYLLFRQIPEEKCLLHYSYGNTGTEKSGEIEIFRAKDNYIL